MNRESKLGVFGGTFNPIHVGHLRAAEQVLENLQLDAMVFVPSAHPPHKVHEEHDPVAPARTRLEWVRAAIQPHPRFRVDTIELDRGGASYTVDTLREISRRITPATPVFSIGCDAFEEVCSWREPQALFALAHFAVTTRPPVDTGHLEQWLPKCIRDDVVLSDDGRSACHRTAGTWIRSVEISGLNVSASEVRERLRNGQPVNHLLPAEIREAVVQSGVYR
ncbi:nicotinate-nucleotide adenylyltransferase [Myxococcota bacterium]|nr:nicotinate-nucleotide adenylyltransferase [Myxococcota bacterium]